MYNYTTSKQDELEFVAISDVDSLPNGERIFVEIDKLTLVVFNLAGRYYAIADLCSHDDGPLGDGDVEGTEIACPRHGARFDLVSGKALSLPAIVDIPAYPVRIQDGLIEVGIPK
jgi:3-phenylpropionate/trans-cinnamate dioxygenase ferredoxin subunit